MKNYIFKFLHPDGDVRTINIEAFDLERAKVRFTLNWGEEMKILNISEG